MGRPKGSGRPWQERFLAKVDVRGDDECWPWTGSISKTTGYGRFQRSVEENTREAHVFAYELWIGPVPKGLQIDHVAAHGCTLRHCQNWRHLEAVTQQVNLSRGKQATKKKVWGHTLADALQHHGRRECRTCNRERCARRAAQKRGLVPT